METEQIAKVEAVAVPAAVEETAVAVVENPLAVIAKDATYGGAFTIDPKAQAILDNDSKATLPAVVMTGKPVGVATYVATKMSIPLEKLDETHLNAKGKKMSILAWMRQNYDKDTVTKHAKAFKHARVLHRIHNKQLMAVVGADPNSTVTARRASFSNKKGWTGFNFGVRYNAPELATRKETDSAELLRIRAILDEKGIAY
jgi:hypothetical protein